MYVSPKTRIGFEQYMYRKGWKTKAQSSTKNGFCFVFDKISRACSCQTQLKNNFCVKTTKKYLKAPCQERVKRESFPKTCAETCFGAAKHPRPIYKSHQSLWWGTVPLWVSASVVSVWTAPLHRRAGSQRVAEVLGQTTKVGPNRNWIGARCPSSSVSGPGL